MKWFGDPWPSDQLRAPVCEDDADRIPTPVGETCMFCDDPIADNDRGETVGVGYAHIECLFRQGVGGPAHLRGTCTCCGGTDDPDMDMTPRQAALWVWEHYTGAERI